MNKQLSSVLIKPAGPDCNLDCTYCFYLSKAELFPQSSSHRMSIETLERVMGQVMRQSGPEVSIAWQGGEPTLMGLPFFEHAVEFQKRYGDAKTVGNGLQTNGLLIDTEWADFLRQYRFLVGLSLDGPQHVHDRFRVHGNGKGSWRQVEQKARLLLDAGVEVNALCCVTGYSADHAEEIYSFFKRLGLNFMQFIPVVETDHGRPERAAGYSVSAEQYGSFLVRLFDLWIADFRDGVATTSIRFFDSVFHRYVGLPVPECTLLPECGNYLVIEHDGSVYACDFFVEPAWRLGNAASHTLAGMLDSTRQRRFGAMKAKLPYNCLQCRWLAYCHGGCTKDRIRDQRDKGENHFCRGFKMFFDHADAPFRALARNWLDQRRLSLT